MTTATEIANYFLSKDTENLFNFDLVEKCGRRFYSGNARLNKYLHLSQNIYLAKTGFKLFEEDMYAYDNGAVIKEVQENFNALKNKISVSTVDEEIKPFLDKMFKFLQNATLDELIELSHEDDEWVEKNQFYHSNDQKMNSYRNLEVYKMQYADAITVLEWM